jgi:hypothetical protein
VVSWMRQCEKLATRLGQSRDGTRSSLGAKRPISWPTVRLRLGPRVGVEVGVVVDVVCDSHEKWWWEEGWVGHSKALMSGAPVSSSASTVPPPPR